VVKKTDPPFDFNILALSMLFCPASMEVYKRLKIRVDDGDCHALAAPAGPHCSDSGPGTPFA
jgi:hypothetical protein